MIDKTAFLPLAILMFTYCGVKVHGEKSPIQDFEGQVIILTTRSNWMLHHVKPVPTLLIGFVGVWLPMMTRGVLPKVNE